jgi:hypothetical protein
VLVLVEVDWGRASLPGDLHGHDLVTKIAFVRGPLDVVMATQGHLVHVFARDAVHLTHKLGGVPHDVGLPLEKRVDGPLVAGLIGGARMNRNTAPR